jgi:hypothetical protein
VIVDNMFSSLPFSEKPYSSLIKSMFPSGFGISRSGGSRNLFCKEWLFDFKCKKIPGEDSTSYILLTIDVIRAGIKKIRRLSVFRHQIVIRSMTKESRKNDSFVHIEIT